MQSSVTLSGLIAHFIAALCSRPTGRKVTLLDVGANSGAWTDSVLRRANRSTCARAQNGLSAVMLEPQPLFSTQLAALAARWSADGVPLEHVPAAAWKRGVEGGEKCVEKVKLQSKVQCRFITIDVQHRAGRGLPGCGRARATTESHDAGEAQAAVRRQ